MVDVEEGISESVSEDIRTFRAAIKPDHARNGKNSIINHVSCCQAEPCGFVDASLLRKVAAEFIATLILIFTCTATAIVDEKSGGSITVFGIAASSGISAMITILSASHISGAHMNPSISIGLASLKCFPWKHVPIYIGVQMAASVSAGFLVKAMFHPIMGGGVTIPSGRVREAFVMEFVVSFILMFVVAALVTDKKAGREFTGIVIGATVTLNVVIAGKTSGASMNPARTLGPAMAANNYKAIWVYFTAPILGALSGAGLYSAIRLPENHNIKERTSTLQGLSN